VIRNAVDDGEIMKQDEAPKNGKDIKKELTSAADITYDPEDTGEEGRDNGSSVEDDKEHFEDTKEMKDSSSIITYSNRHSSTKTEAVARYVDLPVLNHFVQFLTPLSNTGPYSGDVLMMKSEEKSQADQDEHGAHGVRGYDHQKRQVRGLQRDEG
jgi:hypothetical protein